MSIKPETKELESDFHSIISDDLKIMYHHGVFWNNTVSKLFRAIKENGFELTKRTHK
jgi:hypothetical protein